MNIIQVGYVFMFSTLFMSTIHDFIYTRCDTYMMVIALRFKYVRSCVRALGDNNMLSFDDIVLLCMPHHIVTFATLATVTNDDDNNNDDDDDASVF